MENKQKLKEQNENKIKELEELEKQLLGNLQNTK
jgi:hypothetical protein